ncbi:MAG: YraN family protein [Treponema sp.]|jgi:putative endonuclease|nr:YraN family protein [Treponema sp.]
MRRVSAGRDGESRAAAYLEACGLTIVARNIRSFCGEVDLVALEGQTLVFVEVKAWSAYSFESLSYGIGRQKQRRIIETAKYFLSVHREYNSMAVRFDVVFINPAAAPDSGAITHLRAAFTETL